MPIRFVFDDVMKTLLSAEAIAYDKAFSFCWEFVYETGKKFSEAISFPCVGFKKYACIGIDVKKVEIDGEEALSTVVAQIKSGKIVPIHYDGYVCPWDKLQKKRRWHNLHTVLAYAVDDKKRCFRVDDPFYEVSDKRMLFILLLVQQMDYNILFLKMVRVTRLQVI